MNVDRILALADLIEVQPHAGGDDDAGFQMNYYTHPCGTPSCIAGWAAWEKDGRPAVLRGYPIGASAQTYLGLTMGQREELFYPDPKHNPRKITPAHAAQTLRHLAATGEVKW